MLRNYGSYLTTSEKLEFLNLWYVTICVNDILIIVGSAFKLALELKSTEEDYWDICRFGIANFMNFTMLSLFSV